MNNNRRKEIDKIIDQLNVLSEKLEDLKSEEEEYHDNVPESLQYSDRCMDSETAIESMENALSSIQETIDSLEEAKG